ncbi:MAG: hypothetical protein J6Y02_19880 [Pseudobutyrivibrio sp.]|nr:hypothetical protein [Pseudobutyrivibrio sp.]
MIKMVTLMIKGFWMVAALTAESKKKLRKKYRAALQEDQRLIWETVELYMKGAAKSYETKV